MLDSLTERQVELYQGYRNFCEQNILPHAGEWDLQQGVPEAVLKAVAEGGFMATLIPAEYGGKAEDAVSFGLLNEAFGAGSSSLTVWLTVQNMAASSLLRWGTEEQKQEWLPQLAAGSIVGAFAVTEPGTGSDIMGISTRLTRQGDRYLLNGAKKWITYGGRADMILVFARLNGELPVPCIVKKGQPGFTARRLNNMLGFRACYLAELEFNDVEIEPACIIGRPGFGLSHVVHTGLHFGRLSTAFSSVGLQRACLELACNYAAGRDIAGVRLKDKGAIQTMIAEMGMAYDASLLLAMDAAHAVDDNHPEASTLTIRAKYFASVSAVRAATDAVQLLGAFGCHEEASPAGRFYRDAKIMEIIEGTSQVLQPVLSAYYTQRTKVIS